MPIPTRQHGVSIVEAMVALVIVSVGMLGVAAVYLESVKANRTALVRTQAVNLVNDLGDRIRANRFAGAGYAIAFGAAAPAQQGCVAANNCTAAQLAADDLARWIDAVRVALPRNSAGNWPETQVLFTPAPAAGQPERYAITVRWWEPNEQDAYTQTSTLEIVPIAPL